MLCYNKAFYLVKTSHVTATSNQSALFQHNTSVKTVYGLAS